MMVMVMDRTIFCYCPSCLKTNAHFKRGQKWPKICRGFLFTIVLSGCCRRTFDDDFLACQKLGSLFVGKKLFIRQTKQRHRLMRLMFDAIFFNLQIFVDIRKNL